MSEAERKSFQGLLSAVPLDARGDVAYAVPRRMIPRSTSRLMPR
jgi:hypothetical protein